MNNENKDLPESELTNASDAVNDERVDESTNTEANDEASFPSDTNTEQDAGEVFVNDIFSLIEDELTDADITSSTEEIAYFPPEESESSSTDTVSQAKEDNIEEANTSVKDEEESPFNEPPASSADLTAEKERKEKKPREVGKRAIDTLFDFVELFIFTLVTVLVVTTFIFRHSVVSGPSMMNTLDDGDKLIITNLFYEPKYKDIVVVQDYSCDMEIPIVKRVIATEGQKVRIAPEGIYVNGTLLNEEEYVFTDKKDYTYFLDAEPFRDNETLVEVPGEYIEFVVPEDEIFLLGDHRNDSKDSRKYGTIRVDAILGKVIIRLSPFTTFFN